MRAIGICPDTRPGVSSLAKVAPLAVWPVLGKSLLEYWLEHLALQGAKEVSLLAVDRPEQIRDHVGDGARWGLRVEVVTELRELTADEARKKDRHGSMEQWVPPPGDVVALERLPGLIEHSLFENGAEWFKAVFALFAQTYGSTPAGADSQLADAAALRVGMRQIRPGIWAGLRTRISRAAVLHPPCWLGDAVWVGAKSVLGPMTVVEDRAFIESGAAISQSFVGPETYVGHLTRLEGSLAWGNILLDWRAGSILEVSEPFLLCALHQRRSPSKSSNWLRRLAALKLALPPTSSPAIAREYEAEEAQPVGWSGINVEGE